MCGIWAIINRIKLTSEKLAGFEQVKPRGPDHSIIHLNDSSIIGFHRLSINDLSSKGEQPFCVFNETYRYTVIANGQIYNHQQLRAKYNLQIDSRSDCSVILPLFMAFGDDFVKLNQELSGQYAILIIRQEIKTKNVDYFVSTDPLSVRPVFYYLNKQQHEFGVSSILAGISSCSSQVQRLDQGTLLIGKYDSIINRNEILTIQKYTTYPKVEYFEQNINLYQQIVDTLTRTIEKRLMADRPIGCLLSGGLDSSLVAAIAANLLKKQGKKLKTFSIGMEQGTDNKFARQVAKHIECDHTQYVYEQEQGLNYLNDVITVAESIDITTIRSSAGLYLLAKKIAADTDVKVLLNGDGADQCQMGYLYFYLAPNPEQGAKDRDRILRQIHMYDGIRVDRMISHFGMEARLPYLDQEFVDLYYKIDPKLIVPTKERMQKFLIRRAFQVIWPDVLPSSVLWRKKEAFSDGVSSKQKSWYQMVRSHVSEKLYPQFKKENNIGEAPLKFEGLQPVCTQSEYYRVFVDKKFNNNSHIYKHYWLPSWAGTNQPSARVLHVYEQTELPSQN